jgi:hypothetical protein
MPGAAISVLGIPVSHPLVAADRITLDADYSPTTPLLRSLQERRRALARLVLTRTLQRVDPSESPASFRLPTEAEFAAFASSNVAEARRAWKGAR